MLVMMLAAHAELALPSRDNYAKMALTSRKTDGTNMARKLANNTA